MKTWRLKKTEIAVAVFILLFSIGLRVNAPTADLPSHLTFSGSILTDEGNQCHNSRSKALYGEWFPDDWRITNYNPVLPWIKYSVFKIFGVGLWQVRLVNYIFAALSLLFFFLTLKSYFRDNFKFALLGILLLGANFLYVMYNKIGTFETSIIFWIILTFYFLEKFRDRKRGIFLCLAGASTFMTFIFKSITAYVLPLPFIAYILLVLFQRREDQEEKISLKKGMMHLFFILLGMLVLFVPWYLLHYLPNREWIISSPGQFMGNLIFPKSLKMAFNNFLNFPWRDQFYKIPIVWLGAVLYVPLFFRRLVRKEVKLTEIGYTFFFFAHTAVFFVMTYRPTRYFIPVIPAMAFLTAMLFERWVSSASSKREPVVYSPLIKSLIFTVDFLWLSLAAYFCLIPLFNRYIYFIPRPRLSIYYFIVSAILVVAAYGVKKLYNKMVWKPLNLKYVFVSLVAVLMVVSLVIDMGYYLRWYSNRTYTISNMSHEWGEKLDDAYIGGMTAAAVVLGTPHKTLWLYPNFVNWDEHTFERYHLTHALLGTDISQEVIHFFNRWPERMSHTKLAKVYHTKNYFLHFYSFMDPYVDNCTLSAQGYQLKVVNPAGKEIKTKVGEVYFFENKGDEKTQQPAFQVIPGQQEFTLKPGENEIEITVREIRDVDGVEPVSLLFYLDYPHPFAGAPLRYEGEMFSRRIGGNRKIASASNGFVRYFSREKDNRGFLAYGPDVPYARGFLIADFKLEFSNLITEYRPLCRLDIYSSQDKGTLAEELIRPADIKKSKNNTYRLYTVVPHSKPLEFRVEVEKRADIIFDYLDLTYYQGYFINLK